MFSEPRSIWHLTLQKAADAVGTGHCPNPGMLLLDLLRALPATLRTFFFKWRVSPSLISSGFPPVLPTGNI